MRRKMIDVVNFIRNNLDYFPKWRNSDAAKLFLLPKFENKKKIKATGYDEISALQMV